MKKILLLVLVLFSVVLQEATAQTRTITGRVTDASSGEGMPGVTVQLKGTTTAVPTDVNGGYSINVPASGGTLVFTFIGFTNQEIAIGTQSTVNARLSTDAEQLKEVVVTALGAERTKNSLPYAAQQVEGEAITIARNPNAVNSLSGKVAGLNITQNNTMGGSTNVVMRGTKSITGNNQALFVVDGVPISNANTNSSDQKTGRGGYDYGNAAADINPDDIESMSVLKGAAATALYGSRAANGVIMITTKKGRRGLGVTMNNGVTMGFVDRSTTPKYQKQYGAGYGAFYGPDEDSYFNERDMNGDGVPDLVVPFTEDASYGAPFDPKLMVYQWNSLDPTSPLYRQATPWVGAENDPNYFFEKAVSVNNSIIVDGGNENGSFKLGFTRNEDKGILPNSNLTKNMINFAASYSVTPKLTTSASVNFTKVNGLGRYGTGYDSFNPMQAFRQWWQTNVDLKEQKDAYFRNRQNITWNTRSATDLRPIYSDNPYWIRYENYENDERYRYFGNVMATYKFTNWFNLMGRITLDSYDEMQEERNAVGSTGVPFYSRYNRTSREFNYDLIANFNHMVADGDVSLSGLVGANMRRNYESSIFAQTNGGLAVPRFYALTNSISPIIAPTESELRFGVDGIFASATVGYRETLFLDATIRRDVTTTLMEGNNVFYYPSVAVGYVFSENLKETLPWMSYGKVRLNYAEVGNDAPPLSIYDVYDKPTSWGSIPLFSVTGTKNNQNLRPERTKSIEAGLEMAFLQGRVGFDATFYKTNTIDQILPINVSTATGNNAIFVNSGEVQNKGVEVSAFVTPVKTDDFSWTLNANWSRNRNEVVSLYDGVDNISLATYQGGMSSNATVGRPFGTLRGAGFVFKDGQRVVDEDGYYMLSGNREIGNPNANWRGGISNTLNYKGVSMYFLVDIRQGGDVFSLDNFYGYGTGLYEETTQLNDLGNPSRSPVSEGGGVILPGVNEDGTPNTTRVENGEGLFGYYMPQEYHIYDASYVKLREVSLSYALPAGLMAKLKPFQGIDVSLVGRNLWIIHKNLPYADPEDGLSSGNLGQGYISGSYPSTRNIGVNLRFKF
ncbi:SusC/RagA family TonB-linked outer membrane protein [Rufibacter glacialis]|uniref:SusC/RagA family TonB-linked outer membrane protein n=1 Tax=Rufibacter glacialis TaxID=1259555 RepID=A0A5M8QQY5_9BACT|nr:SusC/RagA family TonB-linked outer membrane protein [Rufibacter glacialis]KAA6437460.1 SusC/RagA family TonB-linked outer membrane protein [Rufibacter glacialis]GGK59164.1 SusC/RagA family TonB-linked outer membrane protein [Rufibacter glacialis]